MEGDKKASEKEEEEEEMIISSQSSEESEGEVTSSNPFRHAYSEMPSSFGGLGAKSRRKGFEAEKKFAAPRAAAPTRTTAPEFEKYTKSFGSRMLAKMGWTGILLLDPYSPSQRVQSPNQGLPSLPSLHFLSLSLSGVLQVVVSRRRQERA